MKAKKLKKLSKVVLSFALSAALLLEPVASIPVVYAEETLTSEDQNYDGIETSDQENTDRNETEDSEGDIEPGTGENVGTESGSGEEDKDKEDESGSGEEDKDKEDESGSGEEDKDKEDESGSGEEDKDKEDESDSGDNDGEDDENSAEENEEQVEEEETDEAGDENPEAEDENPEDLDEEEQEDGPDGFSAMPAGYELTASQKSMKSDLAAFLSQVDESDEGITYAERRVFTFADSIETAEMIAEAYHAEIMSFDMGVLVLKLSEDKTVKAALAAAADLSNNLPAVWPDYKRELYGEVPLDITEDDASELEIVEEEYTLDDADTIEESDDDAIPSVEEYEQVLNELSGFTDPYLSPTNPSYQWFHTTIGSAYAWDAGYLGQSIRVGVVDSGVAQNSDLNSNVQERKDFSNDTSGELDSSGHGTHVAGIIAAMADGKNGGVGVAPQAKIYSARVFGNDSSKSGYDSTIIAAIKYLIGEDKNSDPINTCEEPVKVDIINMSLGGVGYNYAFQYVLDKAYKKGVVVFAATGNDGGSLMMYPASYNHVIAVAATDTNNQRAYFSNYGSATDLSAPGVNIFSTCGSGYKSMQGTSMACPVAAGEAAVILSGAAALTALDGKTGSKRVDAVESIMKANTISAGSGMGKGITSLPKVFKLSTAAAKPNAPVITHSVAADEQSVKIMIQVQSGMSLCYTTNGKNPVYKNGETDVNTIYIDSATLIAQKNVVTLTFDYNQSAKGTVKAFAVNASGVIGPVKSLSYTLKPYVRGITVSGPSRVVPGKSIQLAAAVTPSYATNKKVDWKIQDSNKNAVTDGTIKISATGKITTTTKAVPGEYEVIVTAKDAGGFSSAPFIIKVISANDAIQSLAFNKNTNKELWLTKTANAPSQDLAIDLVAKMKDAEGALIEKSGKDLNGLIIWTSSKPEVAVVDGNGKVTAKAAGTTTITAKANDSSNKKVTINITVKQAVTDITITTDKGKTDSGSFVVAVGKSMTLKAVVNDGKPKPTNGKVLWSISPADNNDVTINASGKITVKAGASAGKYTVTAEAADNKGVKATQDIQVYGGAIGSITLDNTKQTLYTKQVDSTKTNTATIKATISGDKGNTDFNPNAYTVTSSNESIVEVSSSSNTAGVVDITITAAGKMYGKANVVIASTDGSNKKATCVVTVSGGITKVEMQDANNKKVSKLTMFRKGTAATNHLTEDLNVVITSSVGANKDAYKVTSSNPNLVKATLNKTTGKIKLETGSNLTGKATITLESTDGGKKKATCTVTVCNPPSRINIAPKAGETGSVVPGKSVQLVATMETEDGAISNKNVTWSFADEDAAVMASYGITINATSGKITVPKSIKRDGKTYYLNDIFLNMGGAVYANVCAEAKDGSGVAATGRVYLARATTYIDTYFQQDEYTGWCVIYFESDCFMNVTCSSSAPKVASPTMVGYTPPYFDETEKVWKSGEGYIKFVPNQRGTVTITLKAMDGSGKSAKETIRFR